MLSRFEMPQAGLLSFQRVEYCVNYLVPERHSLSNDEDLPGCGRHLAVHLTFGLRALLQSHCGVGLNDTGIPILWRKRVHVENLWTRLR
jgi:hypothetical protein